VFGLAALARSRWQGLVKKDFEKTLDYLAEAKLKRVFTQLTHRNAFARRASIMLSSGFENSHSED
jgi:hypothetical protein